MSEADDDMVEDAFEEESALPEQTGDPEVVSRGCREAAGAGMERLRDQCRINLIPAMKKLLIAARRGGKGAGVAVVEFDLAWSMAPPVCSERDEVVKTLEREAAAIFAIPLSEYGATKQGWARKKIGAVLSEVAKRGQVVLSEDVRELLDRAKEAGV